MGTSILLGLWALRMPEPPRGQADQVTTQRTRSLKDYKVLWRIRSYVGGICFSLFTACRKEPEPPP